MGGARSTAPWTRSPARKDRVVESPAHLGRTTRSRLQPLPGGRSMKRFRSVAASSLLASALLFAAPVLAAPQTYEIDPVHSRVEFTIRHMFTRVTGSFGGFHGTIQYDAAAPASSTVNAEIDAGTIDTGNDKRDGHLKSPDFFDVAKFPTLTFISSKVTPGEGGKLKVAGTLTMHGVTRPVELDA